MEIIKKCIEGARKDDPSIEAELEVVIDGNEPFFLGQEYEVVKILKSAVKQVIDREPKLKGYSMMTNAPYFVQAGIPTVLWHPVKDGWPKRQPVPWVTKDELLAGCQVYTLVAIKACC